MKIKNEKELFDLFVAGKDYWRDVLKTPFIEANDGRVWASDSYILIMVNAECVSCKYDTRDYRVVINTREYTCDKPLLVSDLQDALKRCPHEPEMNITSKVVRCPECDGKGEVSIEYEADYDNQVYWIDATCPVCDGEGTIEEEEGRPTGNSIPREDSIIKLGKGYFKCLRIDKIIKACEILKIEKIKLVRTSPAYPSVIELSEDIHIGVMPLNPDALSEKEKKSAIDVKFTE